MKRVVMGVLVVVLCFFVAGYASAADKKPDATLKLSQGQFAVGIGYSWGEGVLTYQGKEYRFKVDGLSVIDVGISRAEASGSVYNLKKLEDFNGTYTAASAEATAGGGAGAVAMKNQNGVEINLVATTQGVNLKLSVSGVKYRLKK
jgi:hypothetical protein